MAQPLLQRQEPQQLQQARALERAQSVQVRDWAPAQAS
jgi:hypothetical protein